MQLDPVPVLREPRLSFLVEPVARPVVDDEEDFPSRVSRDEPLQEVVERLAVEDIGELVREAGVVKGDRAVDVSGLTEAVRIDPRLDSDPRPGPMKGAVEPEASFVLEDYDAPTGGGFFFIAGNRFRSQSA
jgi:hypothetical protein